jgi:hypothetical protein
MSVIRVRVNCKTCVCSLQTRGLANSRVKAVVSIRHPQPLPSLRASCACLRLSTPTLIHLLTSCSRILLKKQKTVGEEIPCILRNPKIPHIAYKTPPLVSVLSHPVHNITRHFSKAHFNIVIPPTPSLQTGFLPPDISIIYCLHCSPPPCVLHALPKPPSLA